MCRLTFSFCTCQPDSRVATLVGDEDWALGIIHIYLDVRVETKLEESGCMLTGDTPSGCNELAPAGCSEESSQSVM